MTTRQFRAELLIDRVFQTKRLGVEVRIHYFYDRKRFGVNVYDNHDRTSRQPLAKWQYAFYRDDAIKVAKHTAKEWR
jgi:hypothetical protein